MKRRHFLSSSLCAGALTFSGTSRQNANPDSSESFTEMKTMPHFCSHEHWGSIFSMGTMDGGFRADFQAGALPQRQTTLADLMVDPYMGGNLGASGINVWELNDNQIKTDIYAAFIRSPEHGMHLLEKVLQSQQLTGTYLCLKRGIHFAYHFDFENYTPEDVHRVNAAIDANYKKLFQWYRKVNRQAVFSGLIRAVHPEYYATMQTPQAQPENQITRTVMRIDSFFHLWKNTQRKNRLAELAGVEPVDAQSWRLFLQNMFMLAKENKAVGIKQLQAYSRDLNFEWRTDAEVKFSGELNSDEERILQDWIMHECCKLANDLGWPQQIHTGTHNLPHSNPLPLESIAKRYPQQNLVLLHCWPFIDESGFLAKQRKNIFIDSCWQPVLNPDFLWQSLRTWLGYVPYTKIMMGNDSTSIEMAVGSSLITKEILAESLSEFAAGHKINSANLTKIARAMLNDNAWKLYL